MTTQHVDAIIVGAGFAGISALFHLRKIGLEAIILEAARGVGGTWHHNRYPGARCDIESLDYSLSLTDEIQQKWNWPEKYSPQEDLEKYFNFVVDELDLRQFIKLNTKVTKAHFDESQNTWLSETSTNHTFHSKYLVLATGVLSTAQMPEIPGIDRFEGRIFHTGKWPKENVDFSDRRVAVIGTGSSGTQIIPEIAPDVQHLSVFQRTANYVMPSRNAPLDPKTIAEWKRNYPERRAIARASRNGHNQTPPKGAGRDMSNQERDEELERRWQAGGIHMMRAFTDILTDKEVNAYASRFVANKIRTIVKDPVTAEALVPKDLPIGSKRLSSGTNYYETFNRPNVELVDLRKDPINTITEKGIIAGETEYHFDDIIFATGFDAMTGSFLRIDVKGKQGKSLQQQWSNGPRTYLGLMTDSFPNLFFLSGPQTPSVFSNMATTSEMHAEWLAQFISDIEKDGFNSIEPERQSVDAWTQHVTDSASRTLYADSRNTWFWGANTPGKPRVFMPYIEGVDKYSCFVQESIEQNYKGFIRL